MPVLLTRVNNTALLELINCEMDFKLGVGSVSGADTCKLVDQQREYSGQMAVTLGISVDTQQLLRMCCKSVKL